ncbi:MAG: vacuolar-type H+-ATPase subunit H [Bradymonadia bacterium]|jgi:vacuolar-type H+-ATPase subunit H
MNIAQTFDQTRERAFGAARRLRTAVVERATFVFDKAETLGKDARENAEKLRAEALEDARELKNKVGDVAQKAEDVARKTIGDARHAAEDIAKPLMKGGKKSAKRAEKHASNAVDTVQKVAGESKTELYKLATEMKIVGRSKMNKEELAVAIEVAKH